MSQRRAKPGAGRRVAKPPPGAMRGRLEPEPVRPLPFGRADLWICLALIAITLFVFAEVRHHDFVLLDDRGYISDNPHVSGGLTWRDMAWAWTAGYASNWHPLTWMSHMLDVDLFGLRAGGHHVTSLLLHVLNTLLLFALLRRLTGAPFRSAFVAALFAVHPLHVESVAWAAERKDVLSTMFWLLTMLAYVAYVRRPRLDRYLVVCVCFALGLLAKPMLVTLPFVLLLVDRWPMGRIGALGSLAVEKLPLFALAAVSSIVTFLVQQQAGAVSTLDLLPVSTRLANALVSYVTYIGQMAWPAHLAVFYPYAHEIPAWHVGGALLVLAGISVLVVRLRRRHPYLPLGWWWYLGTLVPVIGLVQVGTQAMADRYTYVPLVGLFIIVAWGAPDLLARWPGRRWGLPAAAVLAILAFAAVTRVQVRTWQSNWTMWNHALAVTTGNYRAHNDVGVMLVAQGKHDEALAHFTEAARIEPEFVEAHANLGLAFARVGKMADAIAQDTLALQLKPGVAETENNLGFALMSVGRNDEAMAYYQDALRVRPDFSEAHDNLGFLLTASGRVGEAIPHFAEAVRIQPDSELGHLHFGMALGGTGRWEDAARQFREVLRINPKNDGARQALERVATVRRSP